MKNSLNFQQTPHSSAMLGTKKGQAVMMNKFVLNLSVIIREDREQET